MKTETYGNTAPEERGAERIGEKVMTEKDEARGALLGFFEKNPGPYHSKVVRSALEKMGLGLDSRHLNQLAQRGLLRKVSHGVYELAQRPAQIPADAAPHRVLAGLAGGDAQRPAQIPADAAALVSPADEAAKVKIWELIEALAPREGEGLLDAAKRLRAEVDQAKRVVDGAAVAVGTIVEALQAVGIDPYNADQDEDEEDGDRQMVDPEDLAEHLKDEVKRLELAARSDTHDNICKAFHTALGLPESTPLTKVLDAAREVKAAADSLATPAPVKRPWWVWADDDRDGTGSASVDAATEQEALELAVAEGGPYAGAVGRLLARELVLQDINRLSARLAEEAETMAGVATKAERAAKRAGVRLRDVFATALTDADFVVGVVKKLAKKVRKAQGVARG
jgi:hypothetical protein